MCESNSNNGTAWIKVFKTSVTGTVPYEVWREYLRVVSEARYLTFSIRAKVANRTTDFYSTNGDAEDVQIVWRYLNENLPADDRIELILERPGTTPGGNEHE